MQIHHHQAVISKRTFVQGIVVAGLLIGGTYLVFFVLPRIFSEVQYPLAYDDIILEESKTHDLDPFLVAAVIYTESHFHQDAMSDAGARGLMQLIPSTAEGLARRMGDGSFTVDKLYDPATNIKYGAFHLQGLMGRYNGQIEPAIVAYNGGGGAGDRYLAGNRTGIPTESLNYVKKVLAAKQAYEQLYRTRLSGVDPFARTEEETVATRILQAVSQDVLAQISS